VRIVTDKRECYKLAEKFYSNENMILGSWKIKNKLNNVFNPEKYAFFVENDDIIPLVIKHNTCYFFGGNMPFNDYNVIVKNQSLINEMFKHLKRNNYNFRLESISNDVFYMLGKENKQFDVPYNQNWVISDIGNFNLESFISNTKRKKRNKIKRAIKLYEHVQIKTVSNEEYTERYMNNILHMKIKAFRLRNKINIWEKHPNLYIDMFAIFFKEYDCINKIISIDNKIVASYNMVISSDEIFLAFSNCYDTSIEYLQFLVYTDLLTTSITYAKFKNNNFLLNAARGNFGYKKRMGFSPTPMYAIINDTTWLKEYNKDLTQQETKNIYLREFGCFL
tara:strand:+ start:372 stop:1376 length:1005 start_codon:yes stop_codon:yes gene_type:complete